MKRLLALLLISILLVGCSSNNTQTSNQEELEQASVQEVETTAEITATTESTETVDTEEKDIMPPFNATFVPYSADSTSLRGLAEKNDFYIGAALNPTYFKEVNYKNIAFSQFNMMTLENSMKMESMSPAEGKYIFAGADAAMAIAFENGMAVRGHTLIWHQQLPKWLTQKKWTYDELSAIAKDYVTQLVTHYKGSIHTWDVLNEIFEENGSFRSSIWYDTLGEDFIALALTTAREIDPDVKLIINDYSVETINPKSDGLYKLAKKLVESGVPLDGVGFQSHFINGQIDFDSLTKNIERFKALGLEVQFTEVDIRIKAPISDESLQIQADAYKKLIEIAQAQDIKVFVIWGITDVHSWVPGVFAGYGAPLLYDNKYQPKPAYLSVQEALQPK